MATEAEKGVAALNAKKFEVAVEHFTNALQSASRGSSYALYIQRSTAYLGLKLHSKALNDAIKAVEVNSTAGEGHLFLARIYYALGEHEKALTYFNIASITNTIPQLATQIQSSLKTVTSEYQDVKEFVSKGKTQFNNGDFKAAHDSFTAAINIKSRVWVYYYYRALTDLALKLDKQAKTDALKIVELNPDWPKSEFVRTGYLQKEGEVNMIHQKRLFFLKSYFLYYYDAKQLEKPKGVIVCFNIDCGIRDGGRLFQIENKSRQYFMKANDKQDGMAWITVINQTRKTVPKLPVYEQPDERVTRGLSNGQGAQPAMAQKAPSSFSAIPEFTDLESIIEQPYSSSAELANAQKFGASPANLNVNSNPNRPASFHGIPSMDQFPTRAHTTPFEDTSISNFGNDTNRFGSERGLTGASAGNRASVQIQQPPVMTNRNSLSLSGDRFSLDVNIPPTPISLTKPGSSAGTLPPLSGPAYTTTTMSTTTTISYSTNPAPSSFSSVPEPPASLRDPTPSTLPPPTLNGNANSLYGSNLSAAPPSSTDRERSRNSRNSVRDERGGGANEYFKQFNAPVPTAVGNEPSAPAPKSLNEKDSLLRSAPQGSSTAHHRRVVGVQKEEEFKSERGCCESCTVM